MPTKWQERYGSTRTKRGKRIYQNKGPLPVVGKPPGDVLYLWSALPQTQGIPGTVINLNAKQFKGYLEQYVNNNNLASIWVRSQRCTETAPEWYSNSTYEVKLRRLRNGRLIPTSCSCPDYVHRHTRYSACKHMIAVRKNLISPQVLPAAPANNDETDDTDTDDDNDDGGNLADLLNFQPGSSDDSDQGSLYDIYNPRRTGRRSRNPQRDPSENYDYSGSGQGPRQPRRGKRERNAPSRLIVTMEFPIGEGVDEYGYFFE